MFKIVHPGAGRAETQTQIRLNPSHIPPAPRPLLPGSEGGDGCELLSLLLNWGLSQSHVVAGEATSVGPWFQVPVGEELAPAITNFSAEDGSGLLDRWPIALELSDGTYVNSGREFQL